MKNLNIANSILTKIRGMIEKLIRRYYPNAKTGEEVTNKYISIIEKEYNEDFKRVLFATSLCCDDVNVSTDFRRFLNRPFSMGGLCGFPFTGYTGMLAFANHIPENGSAFIFYGPHIGITDDGILGKLQRFGQSFITNSCGALMISLDKMKRGQESMHVNTSWDYQQVLLEQAVSQSKDSIINSGNPEKVITDVTYLEIHKMIHTLVDMTKNEFHSKRIFLLGGVIINTSPNFHDYVDIRNFDVLEIGK